MVGLVDTVDAPFSITGEIQPPRISPRYRLGLALVAIVMVLLPLIYLALVFGAAGAVWWHATANTWILSDDPSQWTLLAFITPIVAGTVIVFFMVKPMIARPASRRDGIVLTRQEQPELFALIEGICRQVRAPLPHQVQVDCRVNASASFAGGPSGMLRRNLVLTIGLPLAGGLTIRQLGGVLAHEFGHFAQGGGMLTTGVVRGVNHWFARVVYERDVWDVKLAEWSRVDWRLWLVVSVARLGVWLSRGLLALLMRLGHVVSCFMLRQMEYDADRYEVLMAGTGTFASTFVRLRELNAGAESAYADLQQAWQQRTLANDLPKLILERERALPDEARSALRQTAAQRTGTWDTHPADADRITAAERLANDGILVGGDQPATRLFRRYEALCEEASRSHYEHDLGLNLEAALLRDSDGLTQDRRREDAVVAGVKGFFGDAMSRVRPLTLSLSDVEPLNDDQLRAAAVEAREGMMHDAAGVAAHYRQFEQHEGRLNGVRAAEEFLQAGGTPAQNAGIPELAEASLESAAATRAWVILEQKPAREALDRFEAVVQRRIACAIVLARRHGNPRVEGLPEAVNAVARALRHADDMQREINVADILRHVGESSQLKGVVARLPIVYGRATKALGSMHESLKGVPAPPALRDKWATLGEWVGEADEGDVQPMLSRLGFLWWSLLAELAAVVEGEEASTEGR